MSNSTAGSEATELSLRELILKVADFLMELKRSALFLIIVTVLSTSLYALYTLNQPSDYPATMEFMVNEEDSGGMGGLASLAGGLFGGAGDSNLERITVLAKSDRIQTLVLFDSIEIGGQADFIANHLIRIYDWHADWEDSSTPNLPGFLFRESGIVEDGQLADNIALKTCLRAVQGNGAVDGLLRVSFSEETRIFELTGYTYSDELSIGLAERTYKHLSDYYISRSIEPQIKTFTTLKAKTDSIEQALARVNAGLANRVDRNLGLTTLTPRLPELRLKQEQNKLIGTLTELVKNLETADFLLRNATPYFQIIDRPLRPIYPDKPSLVRALLFGFLIGFALAAALIIVRKIVRDALHPPTPTPPPAHG